MADDKDVQAPIIEDFTAVLDVAPAPIQPIVGQVVHYVYDDLHVPASIMEVYEDGSVRLRAHDNGFTASPIFFDASGAEGTFHYPEE